VLSVFAHISARIVLRTPAKRQPALRRAIDGGGSAVRVPNRSLAPGGCRRERPFLNACDMSAQQERQRLYGGPDALGGAETFLANQGRSGRYVYWTALLSCTAALLASLWSAST
jgi:hypothetical protein